MNRIILVTSDTCVPCTMTKRNILPVISNYTNNWIVEFLSADANKEKVEKYDVMTVPTLILEMNGAEVFRKSGVITKEQFVKIMEEFA